MNPLIATASSFHPTMGPDKAINGNLGEWDLFHSENEKYPWLAIDVGFFYKVFFTLVILKNFTTF